jgi:hypothetical protein
MRASPALAELRASIVTLRVPLVLQWATTLDPALIKLIDTESFLSRHQAIWSRLHATWMHMSHNLFAVVFVKQLLAVRSICSHLPIYIIAQTAIRGLLYRTMK